jgi:DNA-binding transcriptional MerR regulator
VDKAPDAFRTISEVAEELDVPQHVLRFWEGRFAQVKPVKRAGGRRYYRPDDVDLLRGIRTLLYSDGFTIKGVQKILRDKGLRYVADLGRSEGPSRPIMRLVEPSNVIALERTADSAIELVPIVVPGRLDEPNLPAGDVMEAQARPNLCEEERVRLEILLAELLQLKARLHAGARDRA